MTDIENDGTVSNGMSRRGFLKGAAVAGVAAAAGATLSGCGGGQKRTRDDASSSSSDTANAQDQSDDRIGAGFRASADLHDAQPIQPVGVPDQWTEEAEYVVVGTGGGGLAASTLLSQQGHSVITLEKEDTTGGTTQQAHSFLNMAGNGRDQIALGFHEAEYPATYNRDEFVRQVAEQYQFTANTELMGNVADNAGECVDWMQDNGANMWCHGELYEGPGYAKLLNPDYPYDGPATTSMLAMKPVTDHFAQLAQDLGATFHTNTAAAALVQDDSGRVVGVKATDKDGNDVYYHGSKGVILCSGGFGMNPDMVKKYMPTAYRTIVHGGPFPSDSGEVQRMAMGCGADMTGLDSWCTWEYEPDNDTGNWTYFWGIRQLTQLPWLRLDALGQRVHYFDPRIGMGETQPFFIGFGDTCGIADLTARVGARGYMFFDSKFQDYIFPQDGLPMALGRYGERCPMNFFADKGDPDPWPDQNLVDPDWKVQFQQALDDGRIKKADTLEDLCNQLGLNPDVILPAIDKWNKACETKQDYDIYPYPPSWMNPVAEGPFYGAKTGGILGKCLTGLLVDPEMRVMNAQTCQPIPGLYANMMTAGGICGASSYCGNLINTSIVGGNGLSWTTGYLAAKTAMADAQ